MSNQVLVGFHAVSARARYAPDSIKEVYIEASRRDKRMQSFVDQLRELGCRVIAVETFRLDGLAKGLKHQGVVAVVAEVQTAQSIEDVLEDCEGVPFFLVLDNITDPHNLGACLRTADAAGVTAVIAPKDRSAGLNATVKRVACGAAETVPYITVTNLVRTLKYLQQQGVWVIGTDDQASQTLHDVDAKMPIAWVLGAEGEGMRRLTKETCDELVAIPMLGAVESLNVSVASAVCLYETVRQRR